MRALVTGISGMDGAHLARALWADGHEVHGLVRSRSKSNVLSEAEWDRVVKHVGDITDPDSVSRVVRDAQPDRVFHLAAQANVGESFRSKIYTLRTNVLGTCNVLEACLSVPNVRVVLAGSSEELGGVTPAMCPLGETTRIEGLSPYGIGKVATTQLGYFFWKAYGLHVLLARAFNHFAQGRGPGYAEGAFASQIVKIERGEQAPVIRHGNLDAVRDFTDARDTVRAYIALAERGEPGTPYHIASGVGRTIGSVLELVAAQCKVPVRLELDPARMRPSDVPLLIGDASKVKAAVGWEPTIPFEQTISDLVEWYRSKI